MRDDPTDGGLEERYKPRLYFEDMLIFLAVAALFVLGVFFRRTAWGQVGLVIVLLVMFRVLFSRLKRVHKAFKSDEDDFE